MARTRAPIALAAALVLATVLASVALVLRVGMELPDDPPLPDRLMAVLFAATALCSAGLTVRRLPALAWLAVAGAAGIAGVEIVSVTRAAAPLTAVDGRSALLVLGVVGLVSSVAVAAAYAGLPRGRDRAAWQDRAWLAAGGLGLLASILTGAWVIVAGPTAAVAGGIVDPGLSPIRIAARVSLGLVGLGIVAGVGRDLSGPVARAVDRRRALAAVSQSGPRPSFLSLLGDELLPARAGERRRAAESERARLAADLHALVLPDLRRAVEAAGARDVPDAVGASVRRSLEGIEQLMHDRQSIVLEEFGLVAALEWLAERTEERSSIRVELELEGDRVDERSAVPPDVARVVFRVALLALDNVVRHAGASLARLSLSVGLESVRASIVDDGHGATETATSRGGGRGLVDMRTDASAVGATLSISGPEGGTRVELVWPRQAVADSSARPKADLTARSDVAAP